jgi:ABC-type sugar transport system ATPase subunit
MRCIARISHSSKKIFSLTDHIIVLHSDQPVGAIDTVKLTQDEIEEMIVSNAINNVHLD